MSALHEIDRLVLRATLKQINHRRKRGFAEQDNKVARDAVTRVSKGNSLLSEAEREVLADIASGRKRFSALRGRYDSLHRLVILAMRFPDEFVTEDFGEIGNTESDLISSALEHSNSVELTELKDELQQLPYYPSREGNDLGNYAVKSLASAASDALDVFLDHLERSGVMPTLIREMWRLDPISCQQAGLPAPADRSYDGHNEANGLKGQNPKSTLSDSGIAPRSTDPPDAMDQVLEFAKEQLKGKQRRVVELLVQGKGEIPIQDLASDKGINWPKHFWNCFGAIVRELNKGEKLGSIGWHINRLDNKARLRRRASRPETEQ